MSKTMSKRKPIPVIMLVMCALFAALMGVCAQLNIPVEPVPICLTLFAVELCGALLKKEYAALAVLVYIVMGLVGVPVFAEWKAGPQVLFGMTGGYIFGYALCAYFIAWIIEVCGRSWISQAIAMSFGVLVCYVFGTIWFMIVTHSSLAVSIGLCVAPFLPGDAVKIVLAVIMSQALYKPFMRAIRR